ncbi:MAG: AAA family ATPase [Dehalococcoidia bacterium]
MLIGANGAGKTNFISLFQMLAALADRRLQLYVQEHDGPDTLLFGTRRRTRLLEAEFSFGRNGYRLSLKPAGQRLIFLREETWFRGDYGDFTDRLGAGHDEARLPDAVDGGMVRFVRPAIASWRVFHFHDTSATAPVRQAQPLRDNLRLKPDAGNLAPFLRRLRERHPAHYRRIVETVQMVAPFFRDFVFRDDPGEREELEWLQTDDPDTPFGPRQLSDGTLRFICLATLLLQPVDLQPDTILIDEPELGLHPYALTVLAALLRQASDERQFIVSTQSVELVNEFAPEDVIVVEREEGASTFKRLDAERLGAWLEDYALGELWKMNVIGGRPTE